MYRFLHTSNGPLGMTRHFLSEGAQERFSQARFDAIRALARIAAEEHCHFVMVCGDGFESNPVDRKTVAHALETRKHVRVPEYLLPENRDGLDEASVCCRDGGIVADIPKRHASTVYMPKAEVVDDGPTDVQNI